MQRSRTRRVALDAQRQAQHVIALRRQSVWTLMRGLYSARGPANTARESTHELFIFFISYRRPPPICVELRFDLERLHLKTILAYEHTEVKEKLCYHAK